MVLFLNCCAACCFGINGANMWSRGRTHFPADDIWKPSRLSWIEVGIKSFSPSPPWTGWELCTWWGKTMHTQSWGPFSRGLLVLSAAFDGELYIRNNQWLWVGDYAARKYRGVCVCALSYITHSFMVRKALPLWKYCGFLSLSQASLPYTQSGIILLYIKRDLVWSGDPLWPEEFI